MIATTARTTAPTIQGHRRGFPDGSSGGFSSRSSRFSSGLCSSGGVFAAFSGARFSGCAAVLAAGGAEGPSVCVGVIYSSGPGHTPVLKRGVQVPDLSRRREFFNALSLALLALGKVIVLRNARQPIHRVMGSCRLHRIRPA